MTLAQSLGNNQYVAAAFPTASTVDMQGDLSTFGWPFGKAHRPARCASQAGSRAQLWWAAAQRGASFM